MIHEKASWRGITLVTMQEGLACSSLPGALVTLIHQGMSGL